MKIDTEGSWYEQASASGGHNGLTTQDMKNKLSFDKQTNFRIYSNFLCFSSCGWK